MHVASPFLGQKPGATAPAVHTSKKGVLPWVMLRFVIGTVLIALPLGGLWVWNRMKNVIEAHLEYKGASEASLDPTIVVAWLFCGFSLIVFSRLVETVRYPRLLILINAVIGCIAYVLASLCESELSLTFCYALVGVAHGILIVPLYYVTKCFPQAVGVMTGFVFSCVATGELLHCYILGGVLGLSQLPEDTDASIVYEVHKKMPWMMRVLALCFLGCQILGGLIIPEPHEIKRVSQPSNEPSRFLALAPKSLSVLHVSKPRRRLLQKWYFWLFLLMVLGNFTAGTLVTLNYIDVGVNVASLSRHTASTSADWVIVAAAVGRLIWGLLIDAFGCIPATMGVTVLCGASYLAYGFIRNAGLYHLWSTIVFFNWEGNLVVLPTVCIELFGRPGFAFHYPLVFQCTTIGTVFAILLSGSFRDSILNKTTSMISIAFIVGCLNLLLYPVKYYSTKDASLWAISPPLQPKSSPRSPASRSSAHNHKAYGTLNTEQAVERENALNCTTQDLEPAMRRFSTLPS
ncbi:hypothetical protein DIPPA_00993 [Diplonema papillatum]|nr:hypothetical protein DIPPA_00993 [Diplonema papillatum]